MNIFKGIIAFLLLALVAAIVGYGLYAFFNIVYPLGLRINTWWTVFGIMLFSAVFFFILMMLVDVLELMCSPIRRMGGPHRIVGMAAIAIYILFLFLSLHDLWVVYYKFRYTGLDNIEWITFVMAVLMSLFAIVAFNICITAAWGPKDLSKGQSS